MKARNRCERCCNFGFTAKKLAREDLYPLDPGFGKPPGQRGRLVLADERLGKAIIDKVANLSRRHGTDAKWEDGRVERTSSNRSEPHFSPLNRRRPIA